MAGDGARMRVLVTNDDGITAPGLTELVLKLSEFSEVYVASPDRERSANSHCITLADAIDVYPAIVPGARAAFCISGTPADCVMLALSGHLFPPQVAGSFRLVISGINRGHNAGLHVVYSGTVAAAREAACANVPAIAVSLDTFDRSADYKPACAVVASLVHDLLDFGDLSFIRGYVLNINVPYRKREEMRGFLVTHQSTECTQPRFVEVVPPEEEQRPHKRSYRNVSGGLRQDRPRGSDAWALAEGFVAISFLNTLSAVHPPASVSIGPVVEGEWPPGPETTAAAAVGRLIGDLETVKRHLDTVGRSGRDQFSLEDALGLDAAGEVMLEVSASVGDLYRHGFTREENGAGGGPDDAPGTPNGTGAGGSTKSVYGIFESALGFLVSPTQWGQKAMNSCGQPPSPAGSLRSTSGSSRGGTPAGGSFMGQAGAAPHRRGSIDKAFAAAALDGASTEGPVQFGANRGGTAEGTPRKGGGGGGGTGTPKAYVQGGIGRALPFAIPGTSFGGFGAAGKGRRDGGSGGSMFGGGDRGDRGGPVESHPIAGAAPGSTPTSARTGVVAAQTYFFDRQ